MLSCVISYADMSAPHRKLAVFDIDGTIATWGVIPAEIIVGIKHLQAQGYITTVSTGRGYVGVKGVLGENFDTLISPDALLLIEHGTKIVHRDGRPVFAEIMSDAEIDHIIDFIRANIGIIDLVWFNLPDPSNPLQVWCVDPAAVAAQHEQRGHYADVFSSSLGNLSERLLQHDISNVTARLKPHSQVHNLRLSLAHVPLNLIFQDANLEFIKNNVNKAIAIRYALREYGLTGADLLVAGNAINDVEMLDMEAAHRFVVGPPDERKDVLAYLSEPETVIAAESPVHLGQLLSGL